MKKIFNFSDETKFKLRLIGKVLLSFLCIYIIIGVVKNMVEDALWDAKEETEEYRLRQIEEDYLEEDFASVHSYLKLYDCKEPVFDPYWEICEAYDLYIMAQEYKSIQTQGRESEISLKEYETSEERLRQIMEKSQSPANKRKIQSWLSSL